VCSRLRIVEPVDYKLHENKVDHGLQFVRYHGCLSCSFMADPLVLVGCFNKNKFDAKGDVDVQLLRRLLKATSRMIHDYNYYNV